MPNPWALFVFGVFGSIGIGAGVGGFAAYLGLGILDTINHRGNCACVSCDTHASGGEWSAKVCVWGGGADFRHKSQQSSII